MYKCNIFFFTSFSFLKEKKTSVEKAKNNLCFGLSPQWESISLSTYFIVAVPSIDPFLSSGENKGSSLGVSKTMILSVRNF